MPSRAASSCSASLREAQARLPGSSGGKCPATASGRVHAPSPSPRCSAMKLMVRATSRASYSLSWSRLSNTLWDREIAEPSAASCRRARLTAKVSSAFPLTATTGTGPSASPLAPAATSLAVAPSASERSRTAPATLREPGIVSAASSAAEPPCEEPTSSTRERPPTSSRRRASSSTNSWRAPRMARKCASLMSSSTSSPHRLE
mmetsp:Transcript_105555/g.336125  ORF Transcript_105555/g.336125 Transcript_105555/m.336125 type:complete len:204 (-) Transcript_105555:294-905(-)